METKLAYTSLEDIEKIHATLRQGFNSGKTRSIPYRKYQLLQLGYLLQDNEDRFKEAIKADLGRPGFESALLETSVAIKDVKYAFDHVEEFAKPEKIPFHLETAAMSPTIRKEPKGVVLIIAPYNFPLWLCTGPLTGAIAAGNTVIIKPSEFTPTVSALLAELVPKYMDHDVCQVVNGSIPETSKILSLKFDHIFYTGGGRVAQIIAAAAAKFLTPLTLELGGKCPVVIDAKYDLKVAARRILWGKCINAGQVCTSPDYVLVPRSVQDAFVEALKEVFAEFYPDGPASSTSYSRIINHTHFSRIKNLLDHTEGKIVIGGETDEAGKYIAPTVVRDVGEQDALMKEELFGPVLPIIPVADVDEALSIINSRDHALAVYVFSDNAAFKAKIFDNTQSGSACANDVILFIGVEGLPFGGIGGSGYGAHTGKWSFDTFTYQRSSIDNPAWMDVVLGSRFPPYTPTKEKLTSVVRGVRLPPRPTGPIVPSTPWTKWVVYALGVGAGLVVLTQSGLGVDIGLGEVGEGVVGWVRGWIGY